MSLTTWIIEVKTDHENPETDDPVFETVMKMVAKQALASAMLLQGKRKPLVMLSSTNTYVSEKEISLVDDIPQEQV